MGAGLESLPAIVHHLEQSACKKKGCYCGKLLGIGKKMAVRWIVLGAKKELSEEYLKILTGAMDPPTSHQPRNAMALTLKWLHEWKCGQKNCSFCNEMEANLNMTAVKNATRGPKDAMEQQGKLKQLDQMQKEVVDEWRTYDDDKKPAKKKRVE